MRHRSLARWLAPLALATCAVAAYAIVQGGASSGDDGDSGAKTVTTTRAKAKSGSATTARKAAKGPSTYTVKSGDVLSAIAAAHGTTVEELQTLNPSVDASALHVGQKLRLPR